MLEIFLLPFMQRALLAGLLLGALLAVLGVFVVLKRMSFFSDGVAHASLAGVAGGILLNTNPLLSAVAFSAVAGALIAWLERRTRIASDAVVGLIFTAGMAAGVVMISFKPGYQPDLISYLFGNILSLQWSELGIMAILSVLIILFLVWQYKNLTLMILNPEIAHVNKVNVARLQTMLYVIVAVSVVMGMKLLGIVLVSALVIIPVSTAKLIARSFKSLMILSIILSEVAVVLGMLLSVAFNLPTGAVMVLCGMGIFILTFITNRLFVANH